VAQKFNLMSFGTHICLWQKFSLIAIPYFLNEKASKKFFGEFLMKLTPII
jgi:hypothetical protein